ncbi:ATP-binding cassette domain-containing protein [Streptomyces nodosus]|uniref:ATP-binding cassette domain-containing protein n=1 Tax=Streptomyces nodosus TaxID=40318 RepID=A0A0B5DGV9_9ACTN|nr:ATP-binding cassette domain-containing protein [Streptomyces nodosus]AJE42459.1 multidrug ABC transporter ATPase [Streptomyces nodosus]MBB4793766.1 ABC-2 type transport system ATP-binding protein [Streptomyces nodosus]QEV40973.1 ATP-binding cassette domain-containing protein [Streptomyces nodosus]
MPLLEMHALHQGYRGKPVIRGVGLELDAGAFGLLGPNGAGKSTLLRSLATMSRPTSGSIRLFGHEVTTAKQLRAARRQIGFLPQSFVYPADFTVTDFVRHCAWLREIPRDRIPEAAAEAIERVELGDSSRTPLRKLSGGMLRRAGIAQAIAGRPRLVILDEPTTGLDPHQRVRFRELVRDLAQDSCVLLSTHLVEDVAHTCSTIGVLQEGTLRFVGTPAELEESATADAPGDTPLERGYASALSAPGPQAVGAP